MTCPVRWSDGDLLLDLVIQPGARRDEVVGLQGDRIKLKIAAPPVDGKANARLLKYLAAEFDLPPSRLQVERGAGSRSKQVRIGRPARLPGWLADLADASASPQS